MSKAHAPRRLARPAPALALFVLLGVALPALAASPARMAAPGPRQATAEPGPSPTPRPLAEAVEAACRTFDPYFLTALQWRTDDGRYAPGTPALVAFNFGLDAPPERRVLAEQAQVGTVYGLAYDPAREVAYAAAYHKRGSAFGPGGPGAIYAVGLSGGVRTLATLPAGVDRHDFRAEEDLPAMAWVTRSGLGDIDLDEGGGTLFAANLMDGRVYRVDTATGAVLGSFAHGAAESEWRRNARVMGLAWQDGWLYHGVVDSRELQGQPGTLQAVVYRSRADGSEMALFAATPLTYARSPAPWFSWANAEDYIIKARGVPGYGVALPGALLADIGFEDDGDLLLALRDRNTDLAPSLYRWSNRDHGAGDLIRLVPDAAAAGGWALPDPDPFDDLPFGGVDEVTMGGLALLPGLDQVAVTSRSALVRDDVGALRHFASSGGLHAAVQLQRLGFSDSPEEGPNGLADLELLCAPDVAGRPEVGATATSVVATATAVAAATGTAIALLPTSVAQATPPDFDRAIADACPSRNPYGATVCFPAMASYGANTAVVVGFRDTPADSPHYGLAYSSQVGAVWGLAYGGEAHTLYAAAYLKRMVPFGPSGPGAVYAIDIPGGTVRTLAQVPDVGGDPHNLRVGNDDQHSLRFVGEMSLGDLDLSADERELFVMNLYDRRIHRFLAADGGPLGSFAHGAAAEPWAVDARPFALKFWEGRLYHGLVHSAQSSGRHDALAAYVYSSLADGADMRLEARVDLRYARGVAHVPGTIQFPMPQDAPLDWQPWIRSYASLTDGRTQMAVYPQPQLVDIEMDDAGNMILGLHDRMTDMSSSNQAIGNQIEKPALGLGDMVLVPRAGGGWDGSAADPDHFSQVPGSEARRSHIGGLARLKSVDDLMANLLRLMPVGAAPVPGLGSAANILEGMAWYDRAGNVLTTEQVCVNPLYHPQLPFVPVPTAGGPSLPRPAAPQHSEWMPGRGMGDVELLCGPTTTPSPTPYISPTPSPTRTRTPSPTRTATPTRTTRPSATPSPVPTRDSRVIYLPLTVAERCDPARQRIDVILVIDASTSMRTPTRAGRPKIDAALDAAARFLEGLGLPEDQAGLVAFNAQATVLSRLSGDRAALLRALGTLRTQEFTRIHLGMDLARELVLAGEHKGENLPAIVLLTDGRSNPDPSQMALDAAAAAKAAGIRVFTVGLGQDVEPDVLRAMASRPEDYYPAGDGEDLAEIYRSIAVSLPCPIAGWWPVGR